MAPICNWKGAAVAARATSHPDRLSRVGRAGAPARRQCDEPPAPCDETVGARDLQREATLPEPLIFRPALRVRFGSQRERSAWQNAAGASYNSAAQGRAIVAE